MQLVGGALAKARAHKALQAPDGEIHQHARTDLGVDDFDDCAKQGFADRAAAIKGDAMLGGATHGFAAQPQFSAVFGDVVAQFFVNDMSSDDAVQMLVEGIDNAR